jgi:hypothetical protein
LRAGRRPLTNPAPEERAELARAELLDRCLRNPTYVVNNFGQLRERNPGILKSIQPRKGYHG